MVAQLDISALMSGGQGTLNLLNAVPSQDYPDLDRLLKESQSSRQAYEDTRAALDNLLGLSQRQTDTSRALDAMMGTEDTKEKRYRKEQDRLNNLRKDYEDSSAALAAILGLMKPPAASYRGGNKTYGRK